MKRINEPNVHGYELTTENGVRIRIIRYYAGDWRMGINQAIAGLRESGSYHAVRRAALHVAKYL